MSDIIEALHDANAKLRYENEHLRSAMRDCAEDLAAELNERWKFRDKYTSQMRSYECEMQPVYTARALLGEVAKEAGIEPT